MRSQTRMSPRNPFDERHAFARFICSRDIDADRTVGQPLQDLFDQGQALLDLADANPDAGVHIALLQNRHVEGEFVIRGIAEIAPRVEIPAGGSADIAARPILPGEFGLEPPGRDGSILQ